MNYILYNHHGWNVYVREDLKGKHREHCACFQCKVFNLEERDKNCPIANTVYALCVLQGLTLPVWECPEFIKK